MKRKRCRSNGKPSLKKARTSVSSDSFQSNIASKLQTVFDGLSTKIKSHSESVLCGEYSFVTSSTGSNNSRITRSVRSNQEKELLDNLIEEAKSRISDLLLKEINCESKKKFKKSKSSSLRDGIENNQIASFSSVQSQITQKLHSFLSTSVNRKINEVKVTSGDDFFSEETWEHLSVMCQDFLRSAKEKISKALSDERNKDYVKNYFHHRTSNSKSSTKENHSNISKNRELRAYRHSPGESKCSESSPSYYQKPFSASSANLNMMTSPIHSESDTFDSLYRRTSNVHSENRYNSGGVLLLEDAERAPEYLRITIDSDVDEPDQIQEKASDSEEDVVVLGEKRPTYQEITLEEDEEGEVKESVVEKEKSSDTEKVEEEQLYECTYCDKSFRVESLLKFHIKMHDSILSPTHSKTCDSSSQSSAKEENDNIFKKKQKKKRHSSEKSEESKLKMNSKSSHKHKSHREKHKSHKPKYKRSVSS